MTIVCIAGMHRSGTSMVAQMLNLCGVSLGNSSELLPADSYNANGYWENFDFVKINDEILSFFDGDWSRPPKIDIQQIPDSIVSKARDLVQRFDEEKIWGWKDPRNSLTLPFWQQITPNLKVIISLRNPLEVAESIYARDQISKFFGFNLWSKYNEEALNFTTPNNRLITSYNSYFLDPVSELSRILNFLNFSADVSSIQSACTATIPSLRHKSATFEELVLSGAPLSVVNLYIEMSKQAQTPYWNIHTSSPENKVSKEFMLKLIENDLITQVFIERLSEKEKNIASIETQLNKKTNELNDIYNNKLWRFVLWLRKIFRSILYNL